MTGLFSKIRTLTLGTAHDLLDKTIDMNSPSALRQYVRDLEEALDKLRNEAAVAAGQCRTTERTIATLTASIETSKATAKKLQDSGHADMARTKALDIVNMQRELGTQQEMITSQKGTSSNLDLAVAHLEARHSQMLSHVHELESLDGASKAKEQAASAMESASKIAGNGVDISVDSVEAKIRARNDIASEKFDRAMGETVTKEDPDTTAAVDDVLKSL